MVFYRKYRPQKIDDLDSASVRQTLHAVLQNLPAGRQENIPHAFLFTGPKGLGKTSTARIVAKVVNCETSVEKREEGLEPCNTCDQCVSITNGTNVDILEIDAASNRGIDEIRDLKEKIRLASVSAKRKVYIIDEVHMLTTEAFNALLKTLEEPPDHAMFILCTTESHKVPDTIVSRCFRIQFKKATNEEVARSLERIINGEKISFNDEKEKKEILRVIAETADGGFRDATKMLEELSLLAKEKPITKALMEEKYHITRSADSAQELIRYLNEKNAKSALALVHQLVEEGVDMKSFVNQVLFFLNNFLLRKIGITVLDEDEKKTFTLEYSEIVSFGHLFSNIYQEIKTSVLPQLPLELAIIEWCEDSQNYAKQSAEPLREKPQEPVKPEKSYVAEDTEVSVSSLRKQVGTMKKLKALYGEKKTESVEEEITITTSSVELMQTNGDGSVTKEWMEHFWRNLISEMKKYNHTVAGVLRGCTIKSYENQHLIIQTAYKFHKERLDDMKNREALLKIAKLLTGKDVEITVQLKSK